MSCNGTFSSARAVQVCHLDLGRGLVLPGHTAVPPHTLSLGRDALECIQLSVVAWTLVYGPHAAYGSGVNLCCSRIR